MAAVNASVPLVLTFALLAPCTAAPVAEARILVRRRKAGRGEGVLVRVALPQWPRRA